MEYVCPVERILSMVSGKWKIKILKQLSSGKSMRFKYIAAGIPEVSTKILTQQLREMERDGLIRRERFPEIPPRVEYSLTEPGLGIVKAMMELRRYGALLPGIDMNQCEICGTYKQYYEES